MPRRTMPPPVQLGLNIQETQRALAQQGAPSLEEAPQRRTLSPERAKEIQQVLATQPPAQDDEQEAQPETDERPNAPVSKVRYANTHIDNPRVRARVESRCGQLDFDSLFTAGGVRQKVPIIPGKLEPVFQTLDGSADLFIKKALAQDMDVSDAYVIDAYSLMQLSIGIVELYGRELPAFIDSRTGEPDLVLFNKRWRWLAKQSTPVLEALSVNFRWFDDRVRSMLAEGDLGNG